MEEDVRSSGSRARLGERARLGAASWAARRTEQAGAQAHKRASTRVGVNAGGHASWVERRRDHDAQVGAW